MVTVRTYWNPAEAGLAKSVLDNYEIPCAILHENSNLYAEGAQFAVPVRLVVTEDQAGRAIRILDGNLDDIEETNEEAEEISRVPPASEDNRNPWEFLVLAFYLLVPAICLIFTKFPAHIAGRYGPSLVARATIVHFLSWLGAIAAVLLIGFYFAVRWSVLKQAPTDRAGS